jgi:hypothetical protein
VIEFVCDSCGRVKDGDDDAWILGLAAEAVGLTAARREITITSVWDRERAVHPLAVHFCSVQCKNGYMQKLFGTAETTPAVTTEVVTTKVRKAPRSKKTKARRVRRRAA